MKQSINKTATKGETKMVTCWFVTRDKTGEVLEHVAVSSNAPMFKNGVEYAGMTWDGVISYRWRKDGEKVTPFFQKSGAVKLAKAFELLTGERVAVVKKSVA